MIETLRMYLEYELVQNALIVGVLIALCSSLLGVTLVLKRFSYIGDGLSHVAFGAIAIAAVLHLSDDMMLVMPITIVCAILLLRTGQKTRIRGDAAIAMISVGALAVGYLLMNIFSASSNLSGDVCSTLFGSMSILTLSRGEVWLSVILSLAVVVIFLLFYNRIFAVTFDENFARAAGTRVEAVSLSSQRHNEKLPEVTGTSRGNPGFSAMTRERPRDCFLYFVYDAIVEFVSYYVCRLLLNNILKI